MTIERKLILLWLHVMRVNSMICPPSIDISIAQKDSQEPMVYVFATAEYQNKIWTHFVHHGRPPYMEAYFIHKLSEPMKAHIELLCPWLVAVSDLIVLESQIFIRGKQVLEESEFWVEVSSEYMGLSELKRIEADRVWQIGAAISSVISAISEVNTVIPSKNHSVSFVVCHCREPLDWLGSGLSNIPYGSTLYVYEKCHENSGPFLSSSSLDILNKYAGGVFVISQPDGETRGDECTAYLDYIVNEYNQLPDFTVFLQGDPDRHMFLSYLDTVLASVDKYSGGFLHLNFHRHYQTTTPCMRQVEGYLFEAPMPANTQLIGTYCCAQFVVHRDRILSRGLEFYKRAFLMVMDGGMADMCSPTPPRRSSHCYVLEYLWHIIFGEDRFLPFKADDERLPRILRMKFGNENVKNRWDDVVWPSLSSGQGWLVNRTVEIGRLE